MKTIEVQMLTQLNFGQSFHVIKHTYYLNKGPDHSVEYYQCNSATAALDLLMLLHPDNPGAALTPRSPDP